MNIFLYNAFFFCYFLNACTISCVYTFPSTGEVTTTQFYLLICFDFLQAAVVVGWLYVCGERLLSQSFRWKNVLLNGSPQWRSLLDEQDQHLKLTAENSIT
jgi:hypothetical protein